MDIFDRAYSNLGKLWEAMWDNKPHKKPRVGRRAVSKSRLERYTNAFLADDRTYEDNPKIAAKNQRADLKKFKKKLPPTPTVDLTDGAPRAKPSKRDVIKDDRTVEEKESQMPKSSELAERIEKAQERVDKVDKSWPTKKNRLLFQPKLMGTIHRRMLFMNPGDEKIRMAVYAILHSMELPKWGARYASQLSVQGDRLYFDVFGKPMPFAYSSEKREKVKRLYFDPKKASTIQPITDALREVYCNITKRDVTGILKTLETYQRNFMRHRPPKVLGRMNLTQPGILAIDMFFPSKLLGWRKMNCLACMDTWSRFCRCYALPTKDFKSVERALTMFCQEFTALGHLPRRILADKGSDLAAAKKVMEIYRKKKDGNGPLVLHSQTGTPINIIEAMNSQIQRRMQVFRTAGLTDDPSVLLDDITDQINTQKRPDRGNLTPLELLALTRDERLEVNRIYTDRTEVSEVPGLKPIFRGNLVRVLNMTRKEQIQNKTKGFAPKWSRKIYTVRKKLPVAKNKTQFRYYMEENVHWYYRHELLKIPNKLDKKVIRGLIRRYEKVVAPDEDWSDLSDYGSD
jgi:hypothetical protein